jgi:mono/diheme cytochrome c family protein
MKVAPRKIVQRAIAPLVLAVSVGISAAAEPKIDFGRDIQPVLAKHCHACHGPDEQEGNLRLDEKDAALQGGDSGKLLVAGKSGQSLIMERIAATDESVRMPQKGNPLPAETIALLKRWIDEGATWPQRASADDPRRHHWAFQPPQRPALPVLESASEFHNSIDAFVFARLEKEGLRPSPEADKQALLRRLSLDLTGLPPTPEEADAFMADRAPDAYDRVVDRLLAGPHYGERWARRWLDLARYSDTNGYEKDRPRSIWPYRDWVIAALNADMPFDQFTVEQIAGDMLPGATPQQRIATGFHRNTMINEEGGVDNAEFRFASVVDRVATTGTAWLGLTLGCCQCHSHKFDPISQKEYYQFFALLNNADEPELNVPSPEVEQRRQGIAAEIAELEARTKATAGDDIETAFAVWEQQAAQKAKRWTVLAPHQVVSQKEATLTVLADGSTLASGDIPNNDTTFVHLPLVNAPRKITAIRLEVLPHESLPNGGPGRAVFDSGGGPKGDFLLSEIEAALLSTEKPEPLKLQNATQSYTQEGRSAAKAIDGVLDTGWSVKGKIGEPHRAVFELSEPLEVGPGKTLQITLFQEYIHQMTIGRFRLSVTGDDLPAAAHEGPAEIEAALLVPRNERTGEQQTLLRDYFLRVVAAQTAEMRKKIAALQASLPPLVPTLVMQERLPANARVTRIHQRGEFLRPQEVVQPGVPSVLHPLRKEQENATRLDLARWLVDPKNPLVGRVSVNRAWQAFFGRGLVRTSEDFGTQGARPSHPELLDSLALEFTHRGWSQKALHRRIVLSRTYRQSSRVTSENLARDPYNELLARGPRLRVEAEMVRDLALAAGGQLTEQIGGPSVYPPQPPGGAGISYGSAEWKTETGANRFRRGIYTFAKRTSPYSTLATFDAPSGETCIARRERSNTPLQSLTLLNDTVFVEAAQALSRLAMQETAATPLERVTLLFRRCLTRSPTVDEAAPLVQFYEKELVRLKAGELSAAAIVGDAKNGPAGSDLNEWAAWTLVARAVLNLDETITKE